MEIYKPIKDYENAYEISNLGNIKSKPSRTRKKECILKPLKSPNGYMQIDLCKDGKIKRMLIHRLVAECFIDNPFNKKQVNHINGVKNDNRLENLEWSTCSENQIHAIKNGLRSTLGVKNSQCKLDENAVINILNDIRMYDEICNEYKISKTTISDIKHGRSWNHITGIKSIRKPNKKIL
jgi:hypothetical protein